jgi:hypothetical protein
MRPYQNILQKNRAGGVAQGEGPEFKPPIPQKKKKKKKRRHIKQMKYLDQFKESVFCFFKNPL